MRRLVVFVVLLLATLAAHADSFSFNFSGPGESGSGVFTTAATSAAGQYLITGISGTTNGLAITSLLAPGTYPPSYPPENDNLLFYPQSGGAYLDLDGVSYQLSDGTDVNLFYGHITDGSTTLGPSYFTFSGPSQSLTQLTSFTTAATPEPSSFVLLGTAMLGLAGRARIAWRKAAQSQFPTHGCPCLDAETGAPTLHRASIFTPWGEG